MQSYLMGLSVRSKIGKRAMNELYIEKGGKKLRCGYTTGSCAAAASKAALIMLLDGKEVRNVKIITPKGPEFVAEIEDISIDVSGQTASCAVVKDGGDDPDATSGMKICATIIMRDISEGIKEKADSALADNAKEEIFAGCQGEENEVIIDGGEGIGRVTRPGLDQPVGEAAINSVPRRMISEAVREVLWQHGLTKKQVQVLISAPEGMSVAQKTFNPKLGIVGGISILGTTGIVEPMSDEAILATIKAEISIRKAEGQGILLIAPGNYGLKFLSDNYGISEDAAVMCSNFVCDTVCFAKEAGFKKVLFVGHLGKLVKVAGGIRNTHSAYGDHRMEILSEVTRAFLTENGDQRLTEEIRGCVMTDEAVRIITGAGLKEKVFDEVADRIKSHMESWAEGDIDVETIIFSNEYTFLTSSPGGRAMMERFRGDAMDTGSFKNF